ncbi:putative CheW-like signal transduction protein [Nitrospira sp. KM1]|uniref:chemotaxis protein CheW n=1 Tax=Nitrospira sp. KM1 TaxID=1936990 RepID=UPI0013A71909|nr:chemotaxis protein CheW [Nitrospira sp. KM1]BCA53633.1 putative CheW-like signal transduction protein [Nitrospira sp. KM1]
MLRAARQQKQTVAAKRAWTVVVFSVGGLKLAARTEDVGGVSPWDQQIPVPSRTPFVNSLIRQEKAVLPVYDLASRLTRSLKGATRLCLMARHVDGPMAICIDEDIPTLHTIEASRIRPTSGLDIATFGSFDHDGSDVAIVALDRLGKQL